MKTFWSYIKIAWIVCCIGLGCKPQKKVGKDAKPNIIFLLTDDQRWDALSYAGNTTLKTPHLDTLATNGVYFENAYVTTSICAVSRASILTGQYARRHNIWGFAKNFSEEQLQNTYPLLLKKAGYQTGFIGKYGVGNKLPKGHFDYWRGFPGQGTYQAVDEKGDSLHLTQKMGNQALEFIDMAASKTQPFCLSVSFKAPHVDESNGYGYFHFDEKYQNLYVKDTVEVPVTSSPDFQNHFPERFVQNNVATNRWKQRFATPREQQESIKAYYRLIHGVDVTVGRILEKLKEKGQDKNTIIVYTSDNGFYLGEYGFAGKWYGSDPAIRIPMIIYDSRPNAKKGKKLSQKVLNIDVAPTILSLAGIKPPNSMQGKDLTQLIENPQMEWRDAFFYEHLWQSSDAYYIPSTEGVVRGEKKYMKYFMNRDTTDIVFEELYDLERDSLEIKNLIGNPEANSLEKEMKNTYSILKKMAE
ncbi:sulfatase [Flagellimonas meridianipacifica]|uniref:Arylsulfatase A-like enzyme n=1 Tax=Flagellimonas meridianipacifica TaxID=1080225 RepID=A0A2T0M8J4_9FLAO|nr:sulfatase [Allomuricauda pacifica]PRX53795.1 arylsulfatase A-like enzyme [Allomuricauda pacifica]